MWRCPVKFLYLFSVSSRNLDCCQVGPKNFAIPNARILSCPKILPIFLSGKKYCLFSGSWRLWSFKYFHNILMHCAREASFIPMISARSAETFMGLVNPDPFPDGAADILLFCICNLQYKV